MATLRADCVFPCRTKPDERFRACESECCLQFEEDDELCLLRLPPTVSAVLSFSAIRLAKRRYVEVVILLFTESWLWRVSMQH